MTTLTCDAVFEDGVFRPLRPLSGSPAEGQQVRLTVEAEAPEDILGLAAGVYQGLTEEQANEIERVILDRRDFFGARGE